MRPSRCQDDGVSRGNFWAAVNVMEFTAVPQITCDVYISLKLWCPYRIVNKVLWTPSRRYHASSVAEEYDAWERVSTYQQSLSR